jgi:hypothetical protein
VSNFLGSEPFYAGIAPLLVAVAIAAMLARTRYAWLAVAAAYATMILLSTGYAVTPLTVARKIALLGLATPLVGVAVDALPLRSRTVAPILAVGAGLVSLWVFSTVLSQREEASRLVAGAGVAVFVTLLALLVLQQRQDGLRSGAAGLGMGLAVGVAGFLSASIGALFSGVAIAAGCGGVLLVQVLLARPLAAGFSGALPIGLLCALIAAGTLLLAQLPWHALPLLLLVPAATLLPAPGRGHPIVRATVLAAYALVAASAPILAAWHATRGSVS